MDIRTGRKYESLDEAILAGVPISDIAHVEETTETDGPVVTFSNGPFKDRVYRRTETGLVRIEDRR